MSDSNGGGVEAGGVFLDSTLADIQADDLKHDGMECEGCGQPIEGDAIRVDGDSYGECCATTCDDCDNPTADPHYLDDRAVCEECRGECNDCGREYRREAYNVRQLSSGGAVCGRCADNYYTCDNCGDDIHGDDAVGRDCGTYCEGCDPGDREEDGPIRDYHTSKPHTTPLRSPWTRANGRFLGVELEVERRNDATRGRGEIAQGISDWVNRQAADITAEGHRAPILFFEEDGSLRNGFEMISQPMGLDDHARLWKTALSPALVKGLASHDTTTCGLHVHISRAGMSDLQLSKVITFVNDPDNRALVESVARRYNTESYTVDGGHNYCQVGGRRKLGTAYSRAQGEGKYTAVNVNPSRTIEFRIFRGSLNYTAVMAAVEFTAAVVDFCRPTGADGFNLKTPAFLDFINAAAVRKNTRHLRAYLAARYTATPLPAKFRPVGM